MVRLSGFCAVVVGAILAIGLPGLAAPAGEWREAGTNRSRVSVRAVPDDPPTPPPVPQPAIPEVPGADAPEPLSEWEAYPGDAMWEGYPAGVACWGNWYADFEMLFWWRSGQSVPALVTTSPTGTAQANAGVLGLPTTSVLLGNGRLTDNNRVGGRVTLGTWLDPYQVNGVFARYFVVGGDDTTYRFSSTDNPILGRPFFNVSTAGEDARLVAYPGLNTGSITVDARSDVTSGDVAFRLLMSRGNCWRLDAIGGYQIARIDESLRIRDRSTSIDPGGNVPVGTVVSTEDAFSTRNEYHAAVVGAIWEYDRGAAAFSVRASVGLGNMREQVTIRGNTTTVVPNGPTTSIDSGLLTQPSNIGVYKRNEFAAVPELTLQARWYLSDRIALTAGYTLIYYSQLARPGKQIDRAVNLTQVPGPIVGESRPAFSFQSGDMLLHGLQFGLRAEF